MVGRCSVKILSESEFRYFLQEQHVSGVLIDLTRVVIINWVLDLFFIKFFVFCLF